jgi:hypothetical protein
MQFIVAARAGGLFSDKGDASILSEVTGKSTD